MNTKLHEPQVDEETINQIQNLFIESSDTESNPSDTSKETFQVDELAATSFDSETSSHSKQLNVLTRDQKFILEAIKILDDPQLQKSYLYKLLNNFNKPEIPYPIQNHYILPTTNTNNMTLQKSSTRKRSPNHSHYPRVTVRN